MLKIMRNQLRMQRSFNFLVAMNIFIVIVTFLIIVLSIMQSNQVAINLHDIWE